MQSFLTQARASLAQSYQQPARYVPDNTPAILRTIPLVPSGERERFAGVRLSPVGFAALVALAALYCAGLWAVLLLP